MAGGGGRQRERPAVSGGASSSRPALPARAWHAVHCVHCCIGGLPIAQRCGCGQAAGQQERWEQLGGRHVPWTAASGLQGSGGGTQPQLWAQREHTDPKLCGRAARPLL